MTDTHRQAAELGPDDDIGGAGDFAGAAAGADRSGDDMAGAGDIGATAFGADRSDDGRAVVRDALRVGREARTSAMTTVYGLFLVAVMFGAMGLAALMRALASHVAEGIGGWVAWVVALAGVAALVRGSVTLGPVHAEPPVARWLLPTPIRRLLVVRSRLVATGALMALAGAACGVLVAVVSHPGGVEWSRLAAGVGIGMLVAVACLVMALWAQSRSRAALLGRLAGGVAAASCLAVVVGLRIGAGWWSPPTTWGWAVCLALAGVSLGVVLFGVARAARWVDAVPAREAARAGALVSATTGSILMLDAGMFDARRDARRLARRGLARSRPSRGGVYADVIVRALRSAGRAWAEVLSGVALVVPAIMLGELFGARAGFVAVTMAAWVTASRAGEGLAIWLGSSSLWRIFPQPPALLTACFAVSPLLAAALVAGIGASVLGLTPWFVAACTAAVVAGVIRRANAPDMQLGRVVDTGLGSIPTGIVNRLVHGPDVMAVTVAIGFVSWPVASVVALAALAWVLWRSAATMASTD